MLNFVTVNLAILCQKFHIISCITSLGCLWNCVTFWFEVKKKFYVKQAIKCIGIRITVFKIIWGGKACNYGCIKRLHCHVTITTGLEVIKNFSCSTQLSTKFIMLINVKMSTIVGILTFISMINTTPERLKARTFFICRYFSFYEQLKFHAQLIWVWKKFYNLGAWLVHDCKSEDIPPEIIILKTVVSY